MEVPSIEEGNSILEQLGFSYRNYQEKQRATYSIDGVEVDIDTWSLIPTYAEIENDSEELIRAIINKLGLQNHEIKSCNAAKVCEKYGIDLYKYRTLKFDEKETKLIKTYNLITNKPFIYLANVSEEDLVGNDNPYVNSVREYAASEKSSVVLMSAKIESELTELDEEDKKEFLRDLGIQNSGLDQLIHNTYHLLGLKTFFTVGKDEVRAWTFKDGMKAPECAGLIHTDFEKGFIKAEVMSYDDLIKYGNEQRVKEAGRARLEGKDYVMQDGDICLFRFNVTK